MPCVWGKTTAVVVKSIDTPYGCLPGGLAGSCPYPAREVISARGDATLISVADVIVKICARLACYPWIEWAGPAEHHGMGSFVGVCGMAEWAAVCGAPIAGCASLFLVAPEMLLMGLWRVGSWPSNAFIAAALSFVASCVSAATLSQLAAFVVWGRMPVLSGQVDGWYRNLGLSSSCVALAHPTALGCTNSGHVKGYWHLLLGHLG